MNQPYRPMGSDDLQAGSSPNRPSASDASHAEGSIEAQTAKLPSDAFLWAAGASMLGSLALQIMGRKFDSTFVGQWVPTLLIFGLHNKLVKVAGSDRLARA
jgi:hypothetical protein